MSAKEEFEQAVENKMEQGMSRDRAVAAVVKHNPELQQRLIDEANDDRTPPRRAA